MLKMRLTRTGRRKRPYYRVVVTEHTSPRDGGFVEIIGHYDPLAEESVLVVKPDRVEHWLSHGAQPTQTVHRLLAKQGLIAPYQAKPRSKRADAKRLAIEEAKKAEAASAEGDSTATASAETGASGDDAASSKE